VPRSLISIRIEEELLTDIYRLARVEKRTRSDMIRIILDEGIQTARDCGDFEKKRRKTKARTVAGSGEVET